jgi:hypothetical protein
LIKTPIKTPIKATVSGVKAPLTGRNNLKGSAQDVNKNKDEPKTE